MTNKSSLSLALGFTAICVAALAGLSSARADVYVIESTTAGVAVGVHLSMDDTIVIPAGQQIRAVLPSGKTQTIRGPYNGKVADLAKGVAQNEGLMAWLRDMLKTGGSTEKTMGATRGIARPSDKPRGFSWVEVPTVVDGNICVQKGGAVLITRVAAARRDRATIVDVASGQRADVVWEAASQTTAWPAALKLRADGAYQVVQQDRQTRNITLRLVDSIPDDGDVLTELYKLGCQHQFATWLRERKMAAGKS